MHFAVSLLAIAFLSFPVLASTYEVGNQVCDKDEAMAAFEEAPELLSSREELARCLVVEGLAGNLPWVASQGLDELVRLSENENHISASYLLAQYYLTGRTFHKTSNHFLEQAEKYFSLTLSQVEDLIHDDSDFAHDDMKETVRMGISSHYMLPRLFLMKYALGVEGANSQKLLESPTYQGKKDLETHSEYSQHDPVEYLDKTLFHADNCISLSEKWDHEHYFSYQQSCQLIRKTAQTLKELEPQRYSSLMQCKSLTDEIDSCPNYFLVMGEIEELQELLQEELKRVFQISASVNQEQNIEVAYCVSHMFEAELTGSSETGFQSAATDVRGTFVNNCGEDVLIRWQSNGEEELSNLDDDSCDMGADYQRLLVKSGDTSEYLAWLPSGCDFEIQWCGETMDGEGNCYSFD